jgi:hypothetical protein
MDTEFDLKNWQNVKDKLLDLYPQLTDADLIWRHESKNALFDSLATKLVISKKEFTELVDGF